MPTYRCVVLTNAVEGREQDYNRWYDDQHIGDVLAVPGFNAAQRFKGTSVMGPLTHAFMAIYEIETDNVEAAFVELKSRLRTDQMPSSDAVSPGSVYYVYEAVGERRTCELSPPPATSPARQTTGS